MQVFNVTEQGPFPVTIEDFSSRNVFLLRSNGLPRVSNVHPLSITDLLQREECCCYKREDLLKKRSNQKPKRDQLIKKLAQANLFQKFQALTIASCEVSEGYLVQVQESYTTSFQSCS